MLAGSRSCEGVIEELVSGCWKSNIWELEIFRGCKHKLALITRDSGKYSVKAKEHASYTNALVERAPHKQASNCKSLVECCIPPLLKQDDTKLPI